MRRARGVVHAGYELSTETGVHARATTSLAPFVFATGRPRRLAPEERDRLLTTYDDPPFADSRGARPAAWSETAYHRPIQVRFSDVDLLGHVNNVRYFDYVHEAQVEVMSGVFQEARISGTVEMVVVRSEMDHLGQVNLRPEPYDVWSRVAEIGRTSVTFESEIRDGDRVMARSRVVEVNVDPDGRAAAAPRPAPRAVRGEAARVMDLHPEEPEHGPWREVDDAALLSVVGRPSLVLVDGRGGGGKTTFSSTPR